MHKNTTNLPIAECETQESYTVYLPIIDEYVEQESLEVALEFVRGYIFHCGNDEGDGFGTVEPGSITILQSKSSQDVVQSLEWSN